MSGINGGHMLTTGFAHNAILEKRRQNHLSNQRGQDKAYIFGVGRRRLIREETTTPSLSRTRLDSIILTLACGKYRFNDIDLGEMDGIPRILDVGQCNDSYSAIQVALALADAFGLLCKRASRLWYSHGTSRKPCAY